MRRLLPKFELTGTAKSRSGDEVEGSVLIMRWLGLVIEVALMRERAVPMTMSLQEWCDEA